MKKSLDNQNIRSVLDWMKSTDLVEVAYKKNGQGFSLSAGSLQGPLPTSRYIPVSSQFVGVFQWSQPGRTRTIQEGAQVAAGESLAVIVAGSGKPLPVLSPCAGRIAKCLAEEGQAVDYGRPLFFIEPCV